MESTINISREKYYKAMLTVMSGLVNMTEFEIEVIAKMFLNDIKALDKTTRLELRLLLDTSEYNFNNYIKKLKKKSILIETPSGLEVNSKITDAIQDQELIIKFNVS